MAEASGKLLVELRHRIFTFAGKAQKNTRRKPAGVQIIVFSQRLESLRSSPALQADCRDGGQAQADQEDAGDIIGHAVETTRVATLQ